MEAHAATSITGWPAPSPKERVAGLVRRYIYASTAFLLVAGALGVVMRQSQGDLARLNDALFYAIMTAHGLGAFVSWAAFAVMGAGLWVLASVDFPMRPIGLSARRGDLVADRDRDARDRGLDAPDGLRRLLGVPLPAPVLRGGRSGRRTPPGCSRARCCSSAWRSSPGAWPSSTRSSALGSARDGTGWGANRAGARVRVPLEAPRRVARAPLPYAVLPLTVIGIDMIIATLPLAVLLVEMIVQAYSPGTSVDPLLAKNVLWFFGHPVVYLLLFPAVASTTC